MKAAGVFSALVLVTGLSACGGGGTTTNSPTLNASSSLITVDATGGGPLPGVSVTLSTGYTNGPTGVIATQTTDANGQTIFTNLPPTGQLCVTAVTGGGNGAQTASTCAQPFVASYTLTL